MDLKMEVYTPALELVGLLEIQDAVIWETKAFSNGSFSVNSLITTETRSLLREENIIWIAGDTAGIIEHIDQQAGEDGPYIAVKGRDLTGILDRRILWGRYDLYGTAPEIMRYLVQECAVSPTRGDIEARKIPGLVLLDAPAGGEKIRIQKTGGSLLETLEDIAAANQVAFGVRFNPAVPQMEFWTRWGQNRSVKQTNNEPVFYSTELDDVLSSEYSYDSSSYRNTALVAGEGEGSDRVMITVNAEVPETPDIPIPPDPVQTYSITACIDPSGSGNVSGAGTYKQGEQAVLRAVPMDGYKFSKWTEIRNVPRLPEGYTELEYIQLGGSCGIDTLFQPNANTTRLVMDLQCAKAPAKDEFFFSTNGYNFTGIGYRYFTLFGVNSTTLGYRDNSSSYSTLTISDMLERVQFDYNCPDGRISFGSVSSTLNRGDYTFSNNLFLGGAGSAWAVPEYKIYSAKIYTNDQKVRDFIPCKGPDGNIGLYDLIDGKFHGNAYSGSLLLAGPEVETGMIQKQVPVCEDSEYSFIVSRDRALTAVFASNSRVPQGYTEVEFIANTAYGSNIRVNTETILDINRDKFFIDFEVTAIGNSIGYIFGWIFSTQSPMPRANAYIYSGENNSLVLMMAWNSYTKTNINILQKRTTVFLDLPNKKAIINNADEFNIASVGTPTQPIVLFNEGNTSSFSMIGRIYSCTVTNSNGIKARFIPCVEDETGYVAFFEEISGKIYAPDSSAQKWYTAGPAV